ncbi:hypothetical protein BJV78DRAFT_1176801 [Lactifluus subvellereus]|nr:hypothetical protein BJV78DRAFT_1176801 [Lactifluus subvellereus]
MKASSFWICLSCPSTALIGLSFWSLQQDLPLRLRDNLELAPHDRKTRYTEVRAGRLMSRY